jgi:hypothetical protein
MRDTQLKRGRAFVVIAALVAAFASEARRFRCPHDHLIKPVRRHAPRGVDASRAVAAHLTTLTAVRQLRRVSSVVVLLMIAWSSVSATATATQQTTTPVAVTLTDTTLTLSRTTVPAGLVVFEIRNRGKHRHEFEIAGNATPKLASNRSTILRIVFERGGSYRFAARGLRAGVLHVAAAKTAGSAAPTSTGSNTTSSPQPCTNPSTTTVTVTITDKYVPDGWSFSQATIPCGTVTFVLTNMGKVQHGLRLMDPAGQILPPNPGVGPSQTLSITVNLRYRGTYEWSDITADAFGEDGIGQLVVQ